MGFEQYKDVWVFIECFEGTPKNVGLELLGQGRKLAEGLGQQLCAVVIGKEVENAVQAAGIYGADKIYVVQGDEYDHYSADTGMPSWSCAKSMIPTPSWWEQRSMEGIWAPSWR